MTNWDIIKIVNLVQNKDLNGNALNQEDYASAINTHSLRLFKRKLGLPEEYSKDQPVSQEGVDVSKKIDQDLSPFLDTVTVSKVGNTIDLTSYNPAFIASFIPVPQGLRGFDEVTLGEKPDRMINAITHPTLDDPIVVRRGKSKFDLFPSGILGAEVTYYKYPTPAVIAWTRNATTLRPEYDSVNSVELEWDDINKMDIAYMILRDAGVNLQRRDIEVYANDLVKSGK
jgi:hypothetical protein